MLELDHDKTNFRMFVLDANTGRDDVSRLLRQARSLLTGKQPRRRQKNDVLRPGKVASATPLKTLAIGSQFWSLSMHNVPDCQQFVNHTDGFTMHSAEHEAK